jgi:hypothetical protein
MLACRFAGLFLVAPLLQQRPPEAARDVLDAAGFPFLQRMLLPLHHKQQQQQQVLTDVEQQQQQQQQLSVALGLSILSAACRLPDVAAREEVLQLMPLLLQVAEAGGVAPALRQVTDGCRAPVIEAGNGGWLEVVDALESVLACASTGSHQQAVVLRHSGFTAAVAALARALPSAAAAAAAASSTPYTSSSSHDSSMPPAAAGAQTAVMLSVQLMGLLLGSAAVPREQLLLQHPDTAAAAVILLAHVFGGLQHTISSSMSCTSSTAPGAAGGATSVTPPPSTPGSSCVSPDAAALQLEAQHVLLLLLPLPEGSTAEAILLQAAAAAAAALQGGDAPHHQHQPPIVAAAEAAAGAWPTSLWSGLLAELQSKTGVVQRHSALRLAAACLELLGSTLLLPQQSQRVPAPAAAGSSSSSSSNRVLNKEGSSMQPPPAHQLLLVLMEVLTVELPLLLSDAMNPAAVVPKAALSMAARPAALAALTSSDGGQQLSPVGSAAEPMEVEETEQLTADSCATMTVQGVVQSLQQQHGSGNQVPAAGDIQQQGPLHQQQQQQGRSLQQQLAELQLPEDAPPGPEQQTAGERALQCLPACYQLLEGCLELLVQQADLQEGPGPKDPHHQQQQQQQQQGRAAEAAGCGKVVLRPQQLDHLMNRMLNVTQVGGGSQPGFVCSTPSHHVVTLGSGLACHG